jgi:hypothetical protein
MLGKKNRFEQNGLSFGLINNIQRISLIKNDFYKKALQVVNSVRLQITPGNLRTIGEEPLFYNNLFLDENNSVFTLTRHKKQMPKLAKDLQNRNQSREILVIDTIRKLKACINNIAFSHNQENVYLLDTEHGQQDIGNLPFKDIYLKFLNDNEERREWETRWENILGVENIVWNEIWETLYNKVHNPTIQSSIWEMFHLNFWSGYRAGEFCKLCRENESNTSHISNECSVLREILKAFNINNIFNNKVDISFGKAGDAYNNFILFHIKAVVFRSRFQNSPSKELCMSILINKTKIKIKKDLENRHLIATLKGSIDQFKRQFKTSLDERIDTIRLCTINNDNVLQFLL